MFDLKTAVEVQIRPYDSDDAYHEWKAPSKSDRYAHDRNERFIEAVTGERFAIKIIVHPLFEWKGASHLRIDCDIDGTFKPGRELAKPAGKRKSERNALVAEIRHVVNSDESGTNTCALTFGELNIVEDPTFLTQEQETLELQMRGKIEVVLERGHVSKPKNEKKKRKERTAEDEDDVHSMILPTETTKIICTDNGRSHFVKPIPLEPHIPGEWTTWFTPAIGSAKGKIEFVFFYTTRMYMETQKVMPLVLYPNTEDTAIFIDDNDPSPPAQNNPSRPIADVTFVSAKRRASIDVPLRGKNIKVEDDDNVDDDAESLPAPPSPIIKTEPPDDLSQAGQQFGDRPRCSSELCTCRGDAFGSCCGRRVHNDEAQKTPQDQSRGKHRGPSRLEGSNTSTKKRKRDMEKMALELELKEIELQKRQLRLERRRLVLQDDEESDGRETEDEMYAPG